MKTKIRKTTLDAYFYIRGNGIDLNQKGALVEILFSNAAPLTRVELSELTGIRINAVSGRINELINDGYVAEALKRDCTITHMSVNPVKLTHKVFA